MKFKYLLHFPDEKFYASNKDCPSLDYRLVKHENEATLVEEDDLRHLFADSFDLSECLGAQIVLENGLWGPTYAGFIHIQDLQHIYSDKEEA
jgi:hypothetical protein